MLWVGQHLAARELGLDDDTLPLKNLDNNIREDDALLSDWPRPDGELAIVGIRLIWACGTCGPGSGMHMSTISSRVTPMTAADT